MFDLTNKTVRRLRLPVTATGAITITEMTAKQGDINSRFLEITLVDDRGVLPVAPGATIQLNFTRCDGRQLSDFGTAVSGNIVVRLTSGMLALAGRGKADISIIGVDGNGDPYLLTSVTFYIDVGATNYAEPIPVVVSTTAVSGGDTAPTCFQLSPAWQILPSESEGFGFSESTLSMTGTYNECYVAGYLYFIAPDNPSQYCVLFGENNVCTGYTTYTIPVEEMSGTLVALAEMSGIKEQAVQASVDALAAQHEAERIAGEAAQSAQAAAASASAFGEFRSEYDETIAGIEADIAESGANGLVVEGDEDGNNYLYLSRDGVIFGNGVLLPEGGGGTGTGAVMLVRNLLPSSVLAIASGYEAVLRFSFTSIENETSTGNGTAFVYVNNVLKTSFPIEQGDNSVNVASYLTLGDNVVRLTVSDAYGTSRTLTYTVNVIEISITSTFDTTVAYSSSVDFRYTPVGNVDKTIHFKIDGVEIGSSTVIVSNRQQTYTIPMQSHGSHLLDVYATSVVNGVTVHSNTLHYDVRFVVSGNTTPMIASAFTQVGAQQYETIVIPYYVYNPASLSADITLSAYHYDADLARYILDNSYALTVDRTLHQWSVKSMHVGTNKFYITCGAIIREFDIEISEVDINVHSVTDNLELYLTAYGRSNSESTPNIWTYTNAAGNTIAASFNGFNWITDGWVLNDDNNMVLRVASGSTVQIPLQIFASDFRTHGKTIEVELQTRNILNYSDVVFDCFTNRGFRITAQSATLASEQKAITVHFREEEKVRLSFVIEEKSGLRLIHTYINGIDSGLTQYPFDDNFSQSSPVNITIGADECGIDLYNIRVYNNDLSRDQIVDNYIADTQDIETLLALYDRNNVYDDYGNISINKLPIDLPYLILSASSLPTYKGDKKTCNITYVDRENPANSFTSTGCSIDVQGTSSQYYYIKNWKIKFANGFVNNDGVTSSKYKISANSIPVSTFCFKADVASSEGANNVELVGIYNDKCPFKTSEQKVNPLVRQGIEGKPIIMFWHNPDTDVTKLYGKFNFNNDKSTQNVFGFDSTKYPNQQSWEVLNNTSNRVLFKSADFTSQTNGVYDWTNDFEARYPDGYTDTTALSRLVRWVVSTDTTAVDDQNPVNLLEPVEYFTTDTYTGDGNTKGFILTQTVYQMVSVLIDNVPLETSAYTYNEATKTVSLTTAPAANANVVIKYYKDSYGGVYTVDNSAYRLAKFNYEFTDYFDKTDTIWYYLFTELFLMIDSRAKNMFLTTDDGIHFYFLPYDLDTGIGINNEGQLVFSYNLEDIDHVGSADVYNGQQSVLWQNLRTVFYNDIRDMYRAMRTSGDDTYISYDYVVNRFKAHQAKWSEAIFNEDCYKKYIEPLELQNDASYLPMALGSKLAQRNWWLYNRFPYLDTKYLSGDVLADTIVVRGYEKSNYTLTPYNDIYATVKYGSYVVAARSQSNVPVILECPLDNVNDTEIICYAASRLKDIGDLCGFKIGYGNFAAATKISTLLVGTDYIHSQCASTDTGALEVVSNDTIPTVTQIRLADVRGINAEVGDYVLPAVYSNTNLTLISVGNSRLLKYVDLRNCSNLAQAVDFTGCENIETLYAEGTAVTAINLANGSRIRILHLPSSVTNLTLRNQLNLHDATEETDGLVIAGYSNLTTVRIENTDVDSAAILTQAINVERIRLLDVDWELNDDTLLTFLLTKAGIDELGNNITDAVLTGTVDINALVDGTVYDAWTDHFGTDLSITTLNGPRRTIRFYNGDIILQTMKAWDGDNAEYVENTPTKASEPVYDIDGETILAYVAYTFTGWDASLENIQGDTDYHAQFSSAYSYAVNFYNYDESLLLTIFVPSGGAGVYTGETPIKPDSTIYAEDGITVLGYTAYAFNAWDVAFNNVQGNIDVHAQYTSTDYYIVVFINYDDTVLLNTYVQSGLAAVYNEDTPTRDYDAVNHIVYEFSGWSPDINGLITTKTTLTAQFNNITWYLPELASDVLTIRSAYNVTTNEDGSITID